MIQVACRGGGQLLSIAAHVNLAPNQTKSTHRALCKVKGGCKCEKPSNGQREQEVTKRSSFTFKAFKCFKGCVRPHIRFEMLSYPKFPQLKIDRI